MNAAAFWSQQAEESLPSQGLPYWTLWLLLCVIVLLLAFIFLRDKDLRRRVDFFLSGAKRRMQRTRIQMRLNKAKRKRSFLLFELGRLCWSARLPIPRTAALLNEIDGWEEKRLERQSALKASLAKVMELQRQMEESRSRTRSLAKLKEAGQAADSDEIHEARERERHIRREIRVLDRKIRTDQASVKRLEFERRIRLEALGSLADEARPPQPDLQDLYGQIDAVNRSILHYLGEIESLFG
jgi:chromosome segregation ATPase